MILAQLSDPHMRLPPDDDGAGEALAAAVRAVLALDPLPDAVIVTGDLANGATPEEYARVRELLAPLPMPVHLLPGNHDDPAVVPAGYAVRVGEMRLVACDTTIPGRDDGALDLEWLAACLDEDRESPTIVAMHHPPILTGMPVMDALGLPEADRAAFAELIAGTPQVKRVVSGHVHRAATGESGGRPVFVCPSSHLQLALDLEADEISLVREPPCFALHVATGCEVVSHLQPVGDYGPSFS
jgi:3',5'-cyclic AMP phosphodiesterase CpdA